jgi:hypothetical protein
MTWRIVEVGKQPVYNYLQVDGRLQRRLELECGA